MKLSTSAWIWSTNREPPCYQQRKEGSIFGNKQGQAGFLQQGVSSTKATIKLLKLQTPGETLKPSPNIFPTFSPGVPLCCIIASSPESHRKVHSVASSPTLMVNHSWKIQPAGTCGHRLPAVLLAPISLRFEIRFPSSLRYVGVIAHKTCQGRLIIYLDNQHSLVFTMHEYPKYHTENKHHDRRSKAMLLCCCFYILAIIDIGCCLIIHH